MRELRGRIQESAYRGFRSVEMESKDVLLIMIPELGGKIVSLQYKPGVKEWLVGPGARDLNKAVYGSAFVDADMCGWDECFPTIIACSYPADGAYKGAMLPDHGELWSIPWNVHIQDKTVVCKAAGRVLPYEFTRNMYFLDDQTLRFEYEVTNLSDETLSVMWSAHPQFVSTEHTRICLPQGIDGLLCVDGGRSLETGRTYHLPTGMDQLDAKFTRIGPAVLKDSRKYYVDGRLPRGCAGLYEQNSGHYVTLEWQLESVPYLGIWIDEGAYNERAVCALEPCNGYYDSLVEACRRGKLLSIGSERKAGWDLEVRLGCDPCGRRLTKKVEMVPDE